MTENYKNQGLVICSITVRQGIGFAVPLAIQTQRVADSFGKPSREHGAPLEDRNYLEINPGLLRIKRKLARPSKHLSSPSKRKAISQWSPKSRANMVARFSSLDYTEMFSKSDPIPVMLTLTYPGDWLTVAPTAKASKAHLANFKKRFEREYKVPFYGLWRAEFQRRGAVHFHVFCVAPVAVPRFRDWVAKTWADVVAHPVPSERAKHLKAGTAVDYALGSTADSPKRIAVYFAKHSSPNTGKKEYQNHPPLEWTARGTVGRFWGYWHLTPKSEFVELLNGDAILASRIIRRWHRAKRVCVKKKVVRVNQRTGEITHRWVNRRVRRFNGVSGFLATEASLQIAKSIARAIALKDGDLGKPKDDQKPPVRAGL